MTQALGVANAATPQAPHEAADIWDHMNDQTTNPNTPPPLSIEDMATAAKLAGHTIGKTAIVHKQDAGGALTIDAYTGEITTPLDERPEWSDGLTNALLHERHQFYLRSVGPSAYTDAMRFPEMIAYEDLSWLYADAEGEPEEIEADAEFRMNVIAELAGIEGRTVEHFDTMVASEISMDRERTADEHAAFEDSKEELRKTGT